MSDKIFAFTFVVIAFFVLGFTISRAVFNSKTAPSNASDTAAISEQSAQEIPEEELIPVKEPAILESEATSTALETATESVPALKDAVTVTIKSTPTGWLNVREGPGITYAQIKRINPKETYTLSEEKYGWYKIYLDEKNQGWIASQYATKSRQP